MTRPPAGLLFSAGRLVGFLLLAGAAVLLLAGVVLLPAWARLAEARYGRACPEARTADLEALAEAQERLIAALPKDEVLAMRLAIKQESLAPSDRVAYALPTVAPAGPPLPSLMT